jgi:RHS repeat-associated protein
VASYSYDALDRILSMSWQRNSSTAFASWSYAYSSRGQRLTSTDITGRQAAYGYDADGWLRSEIVTGDPRGAALNGSISYVLDPAGNRLSQTSTLVGIASQNHVYNSNDELDSDSYDLNGDTIASGGHSYAYDFENRLVSKDGGAVTIVYDGDGNRVSKTVGGLTTRYLIDDLNPTGYLQVLEELSGAGVQTRYTYGTAIVSKTLNASGSPTSVFYGYDAHGNITFLTDASGAVTDSYDYDAWGNVVASVGSTPNTRRFAGEEYDDDLGLTNLRARNYQPGTGRFLTLDPVMGKRERPITMNRYLYAGSDPVGLSDPTGGSEFDVDLASMVLGSRVLLVATALLGGAAYAVGAKGMGTCIMIREALGVAVETKAPGAGGFVALTGAASCPFGIAAYNLYKEWK